MITLGTDHAQTRYIVRLSEEEQQSLKDLVSTGKAAAYKIKHANILLNIDVNGAGWTDAEAATALSCHRNTVANLRQRLVEQGLEAALWRSTGRTGTLDVTVTCRQSSRVRNCPWD